MTKYKDPTPVGEKEEVLNEANVGLISKKYAEFIRTKMFGIDTRESIARAIEAVAYENELLIDEMVDNAAKDIVVKVIEKVGEVNADAEIVAARNSEIYNNNNLLGNRLDKIESSMYLNAKQYINANENSGKTVSKLLQELLDKINDNNGGTLFFQTGEYEIDEALIVYRNTTILLEENAVLKRGANASTIFINYLKDTTDFINESDPYSGQGNITIDGGIIDGNIENNTRDSYSFLWFGAARNITFRNITFKNLLNGHALDLNGLDNINIDNCKFLGYKNTIGETHIAEWIQLTPFRMFGTVDTRVVGTNTKNIAITNCVFNKSDEIDSAGIVAIGDHTAMYNSFVENVTVSNCIFNNFDLCAIKFVKWNNVSIENNKFNNNKNDISFRNANNIGSESEYFDGTQFVSSNTAQAGENIIMRNNLMSFTKKLSVECFGNNEALYKNIFVKNNIFLGNKNVALALFFKYCEHINISKNDINSMFRGIDASFSSFINVRDNYINSTEREGILVSELTTDPNFNKGYTANVHIDYNIIKNTKFGGIVCYYTKNGFIENNRLENTANITENTRNSLTVANYSINFIIRGNTIFSGEIANKYGIEVNSTCTNVLITRNNQIEGKTKRIYIAGTNNYIGDIIHLNDGNQKIKTYDSSGNVVII